MHFRASIGQPNTGQLGWSTCARDGIKSSTRALSAACPWKLFSIRVQCDGNRATKISGTAWSA